MHQLVHALEEALRKRSALTFAIGDGALYSMMRDKKAWFGDRRAELATVSLFAHPEFVHLVVIPLKRSITDPLRLVTEVVSKQVPGTKVLVDRDLELSARDMFSTRLHRVRLEQRGRQLMVVDVLWGSPTMYTSPAGLMQGVFVNRDGWLPVPDGEAFIAFFETLGLMQDPTNVDHRRRLLATGVLSLALRPVDPNVSLIDDSARHLGERLLALVRACKWWASKDLEVLKRVVDAAVEADAP